MRVELLQPDVAPSATPAPGDPGGFAKAIDEIGAVLNGATRAEDAYASGTGSLQDAVYERARADIAVSLATATAQRASQAVTSILTMQI